MQIPYDNGLSTLLGLAQMPTNSYEFGGQAFNTQELWCKISEKINVIIEHFNYLDKNFTNEKENTKEKFEYLLGEGLSEQVARILLEKIADGTLGKLINETLLKDINDKVDNTKEELNSKINETKEELNIKINETKEENTAQILFNKIKNSKSKLIGHRGVNSVYPENTALAIQKACELGYFGVEFDILTTSDGEFILMHDDTVDRTTDGTGLVSNMTLAQIKALNIIGGNGNPSYYKGLRVPTLAEILNIIQQYNTIACIELKASSSIDYDKLLSIINKYGLEEKIMILSFDYSMLQEVRKRNGNITIAYNADITSTNIEKCKALKNTLISTPTGPVSPLLIKDAHEKGIGVIAYSATSITVFKKFLNLGVDLMTTDNLIQGGNIND